MAGALTANDIRLMSIIHQVCSALSLLGCLFIILSFCFCRAFHKAINRLVFYASFGNIMASVGFIMADKFLDSPNGAGCQTQAFLLHSSVQADALWTLAMAVNVYLAFYHRFDVRRLRRMEPLYLFLCYGIPCIVAFTLIFVRGSKGQKVYGSAGLWCWIASDWDDLRIATFYGPIWAFIVMTLAIYVRSGGTIYTKHQQLLKAQRSSSGGISLDSRTINDLTVDDSARVNDVTVTLENPQRREELQTMGNQVSVHAVGNSTTLYEQMSTGTQLAIRRASSTPYSNMPRAMPSRRGSGGDHDKAAWQYTKCALLFFAVILITWIPSSANRMYSYTHHGQVSVPLQFLSAVVLPLQGFWNAVIYAFTSMAACKALLVETPLLSWRPRRNESVERTTEETQSRWRSKLRKIVNLAQCK